MESAERIINKIKQEDIKPKARWKYTGRNALMWLVMLLSVIAGALAFSIILFAVQQIDFDLISHMSHSRFEWWLGLLPFIWIISLIIFTGISVFGLKYTRKGYKYSLKKLIYINITFSVLAGALFFVGGGAKWLENIFADNIRGYESVQAKKMKIWSVPEEGYLSGYITNVEDSVLILKDFNDKQWTIDIGEARISIMVELINDELIKIIGNMDSENHFTARELRPWGGFGQGGGRPAMHNKP